MFPRHPQRLLSAHIAVASLLLAPMPSSPAGEDGVTHHVANNGIDSTSCGQKARPCRSISRAIQQASDGDQILVGPGRYGDANSDGDFSDAGDELLDTTSFPGTCLVCVNKRLRVLSTHGADLTIIDGAGTESFGPVEGVSIIASGVAFGAEHQGFTVRSISNIGLVVQPTAADVIVEGNHSSGNGIASDSSSGRGFVIWVAPGVTRVRKNVASDNNFDGIFVAPGNANAGAARVIENISTRNPSFGFVIGGETARAYDVIGNIATGNATGFTIRGIGHRIRLNVAAANRPGNGISLSGENLRVVANSIIGNQGAGIFFGFDSVTGPIDIHRNNIYGNVGRSSTSEPNCGILNGSGRRIDATNNFWGAPTGPGPDPADAAGRRQTVTEPLCDPQDGSETVVVPFARKPFPIETKVAPKE